MAEQDPLDDLDYYSLLELESGCSTDDVRRAFHRFAAKYHPDKFVARGADGRTVERAAQIYRRGAEAYKVLSDGRRRKLYDGQLAEGHVRFDANVAPPEPVRAATQWPIKVRSPLARPFATKAEQAYKAGDFGNAKVNLKLALSKDPDNAQINALLAELAQRSAGG